jgi:hypothetical protein
LDGTLCEGFLEGFEEEEEEEERRGDLREERGREVWI